MKHIDAGVAKQVLSDERVKTIIRAHAFCDEGSGWIVGSKASAIRCLGLFEPEIAFVAARTAFVNSESHDREWYPSLLLEINAEKAAELLVEQYQVEASISVKHAIRVSLVSSDVCHLVNTLSASAAPSERLIAMEVAGDCGTGDWVEPLLRIGLSDEAEEVAQAAALGFTFYRQRQCAIELSKAIMSTHDASERFVLLDCLLSTANPGNRHHRWPLEGAPIGDVLSPYQSEYVSKQLKKKREKLAKAK